MQQHATIKYNIVVIRSNIEPKKATCIEIFCIDVHTNVCEKHALHE